MTKTELMENYTAEHLAETVIELQNGKENKAFKVSDNKNYQKELEEFLKENPLASTINKISRDILEQKNNAMTMEFTRIICDLLKKYGVHVHCTEIKFGEKITTNSIEEEYGIIFDSMDFSQHDKEFTDKIEELENKLNRSQNTVNQIDDILEKLFGVRHDTVGKPDEFEKILTNRVKGNVSDLLPTEPIKVADMLINASKKRKNCMTGKEYDKYIFEKWQLRQIAEHLLVYCNHNKGEEE